MKKLFKVFVVLAIAVCILPVSVSAEEDPLIIKFENFKFKTYDYNVKDVYVTYFKDETGEHVKIFSKNDNKLLETIRYSKEDPLTRAIDGPYVFVRDVDLEQAVVRISIHADIYSSGSFFEVNLISTTGLNIVSGTTEAMFNNFKSSQYVIEDPVSTAYSSTGKFPTTSISYSGSGVLKFTVSHTIGANVGLPGFSVEQVNGITSHVRKYFSFTGEITK